jgi:hypothetical protein
MPVGENSIPKEHMEEEEINTTMKTEPRQKWLFPSSVPWALFILLI